MIVVSNKSPELRQPHQLVLKPKAVKLKKNKRAVQISCTLGIDLL